MPVPQWATQGEGMRRWEAWDSLGQPGPQARILPESIQATGLFRGGRGIFRHKVGTATDRYPDGITLSDLHTNSVYADELTDAGVQYNYPVTQNPGMDAGEVQATKNARDASLPLVVIVKPTPASNFRHVRLG